MADRPSLASPAVLIATWFGSGYIKPAPGTWGTLAGLPFAWMILWVAPPAILVTSAAALFVVGIWAANRFDAQTQGHDASEIVVDEVVGVWLTIGIIAMFVPLNGLAWGLAFVLFRLFDIVKPFPIRQIDRAVAGGLGVMLDDVIAGVLAGAMALALFYFMPTLHSL